MTSLDLTIMTLNATVKQGKSKYRNKSLFTHSGVDKVILFTTVYKSLGYLVFNIEIQPDDTVAITFKDTVMTSLTLKGISTADLGACDFIVDMLMGYCIRKLLGRH